MTVKDHALSPPRLGEADVLVAVLESTLRPGGLVARGIADELERLALVAEHNYGRQLPATLLRQLAAEWREGRR